MDYIVNDKYLDHNLQFFNPAVFPLRKSQDRIRLQWTETIYLCLSTGLLIANGHLHDDRNVGKFTFCSLNGQSVVDYLFLNFYDFESVSYFDVLSFNECSDHAPVTLHFTLKPKYTKPETSNNDFFISRKIVWEIISYIIRR